MQYYKYTIPYQGVYRLKLPLTESPLGFVNAYLLASPSGYMLIDTGWNTEDTFAALLNQLKDIGVQLSDITRIVITHAHVDHYGMAARILRHCRAKLEMHRKEKIMVMRRYRNISNFVKESNDLLRTGGVAEHYITDPKKIAERFDRLIEFAIPDIIYDGGEILEHGSFNFKIIWTPGHSPGHICLYDTTHKIIFSGDHVLQGITSHVGLYPKSDSNPLDEYLNSLRALLSLDVELVLPAHGPPIKGFVNRLKQIIAHHQRRKNQILQLFAKRKGPVSPFELATQMEWYSKGHMISWHSLSDLDHRLAITEVMAHLESLSINGDLIKSMHKGVVNYQLPVKTRR